MTLSRRTSVPIVDIISKIGGFIVVLFLIFGTFAEKISHIFFQGNIASTYFVKKKTGKYDEVNEENEISDQFEKIEISKLQILGDYMTCVLFKPCKRLLKPSTQKRVKLL